MLLAAAAAVRLPFAWPAPATSLAGAEESALPPQLPADWEQEHTCWGGAADQQGKAAAWALGVAGT